MWLQPIRKLPSHYSAMVPIVSLYCLPMAGTECRTEPRRNMVRTLPGYGRCLQRFPTIPDLFVSFPPMRCMWKYHCKSKTWPGLQLHWRWTLPILLTRHEVLETGVPKITIHQESILSWATSDAWRGTNQSTLDHTCNIWNDRYRGVTNFRKLKQIFFRRNRCSIPSKKQRCKSTFSGAVFCTKTYRRGEIFYSLHSRLRFRFLTKPEVKDTLHQLSALSG